MTNEERKKLAELCGFTESSGYFKRDKDWIPVLIWKPDEFIEQAMMVEEAIGKLGDFVKVKYASTLHKNYGMSVFLFDLIHATAEQRSRAALAAKEGRWLIFTDMAKK